MGIKLAVGSNGKSKAANRSADVLETVRLFKAISPANGGFLGLPQAQPALAQAERGVCTGNDDDGLVGVITRFQGRWESEVGQEYKLTTGTSFPRSLTMNKIVRLVNQSAVQPSAAITPNLTALAVAQSDKQAVDESNPEGGDLDWFIKKLTGGEKTRWRHRRHWSGRRCHQRASWVDQFSAAGWHGAQLCLGGCRPGRQRGRSIGEL